MATEVLDASFRGYDDFLRVHQFLLSLESRDKLLRKCSAVEKGSEVGAVRLKAWGREQRAEVEGLRGWEGCSCFCCGNMGKMVYGKID